MIRGLRSTRVSDRGGSTELLEGLVGCRMGSGVTLESATLKGRVSTRSSISSRRVSRFDPTRRSSPRPQVSQVLPVRSVCPKHSAGAQLESERA